MSATVQFTAVPSSSSCLSSLVELAETALFSVQCRESCSSDACAIIPEESTESNNGFPFFMARFPDWIRNRLRQRQRQQQQKPVRRTCFAESVQHNCSCRIQLYDVFQFGTINISSFSNSLLRVVFFRYGSDQRFFSVSEYVLSCFRVVCISFELFFNLCLSFKYFLVRTKDFFTFHTSLD